MWGTLLVWSEAQMSLPLEPGRWLVAGQWFCVGWWHVEDGGVLAMYCRWSKSIASSASAAHENRAQGGWPSLLG